MRVYGLDESGRNLNFEFAIVKLLLYDMHATVIVANHPKSSGD